MRHLAIALETVGCAVVLFGIAMEVYFRADWYFVIPTIGAWVVAAGALLWTKVVRRGN